MTTVSQTAGIDWQGPGATERRRRVFSWQTLLWSLVFPPKRHRISLTVPGLFLMGLAVGIGTAAYNTASNILFITLSLLLACLLLSGLLSWFNFMGTCWRVIPPGPWRAGHDALVTIEVENRKSWLPSYSLWFELTMQPRHIPPPDKPVKEMKMREILAAAEKHITRGRVHLRDRLEPRGATSLDWGVKPTRRGAAVVELAAVGSLFPFGFLRKNIGTALKQSVLVWPAQVEYQWTGAASDFAGTSGQRTARVGTGDDLLALRKYERGDSHRQIHWKASARLGQLMIRQFSAESHDGYILRLDTPAGVWTRPEQFELLCSFAGTLAEDLYASGRLRGVILNGESLIETRRVRDLEGILDQLAMLEPVADGRASPSADAKARTDGRGETNTPARRDDSPYQSKVSRNVITFAPEGARGVTAYVDGRQTAAA